MNFTAEAKSRNVLVVTCNGKSGDEFCFLLRSDAHHDNPECDRKLEYKHLDEAVERGAGIIDAGDLSCLMQGRWDKRADKSKLRPEHQHGDYLDRIVATAADDYAKYAKNWLVMGQGNHETAVRKAHETDITERIVERMNAKHGTHIQCGGYSGWVRFQFQRTNYRDSRLLHYYHGSGGGGPVTRGVIQTNRMAVYTPDADIILTGHTHDAWIVPIARQRINKSNELSRDEQIHVRTPGYKDGWGDGYGGWEVERMLGPKPKGAAWLKFVLHNDHVETFVDRAT